MLQPQGVQGEAALHGSMSSAAFLSTTTLDRCAALPQGNAGVPLQVARRCLDCRVPGAADAVAALRGQAAAQPVLPAETVPAPVGEPETSEAERLVPDCVIQ